MAAVKKETSRAVKEWAPTAISFSSRYSGDQYRRASIGAIHSLYFSPGRDAGRNRTGLRWKKLQSPTTTNSSAHPEPTSPEVGCMGQVRCQNQNHDHRASPKLLKPGPGKDGRENALMKIKKLFSSKWARRKDGDYEFIGDNGNEKENTCHAVSIKINPPLQIIKDVAVQGHEGSSLWQRRSRGLSLKKLQIVKPAAGSRAGSPFTV